MIQIPITALIGKGVKCAWIKSGDDAFQEMYALLAEALMVSLTKYEQIFDVRINTSKY